MSQPVDKADRQQTIFGMTPMVRGDTLNGIVKATARKKIIEFSKKKKAFEDGRYIGES